MTDIEPIKNPQDYVPSMHGGYKRFDKYEGYIGVQQAYAKCICEGDGISLTPIDGGMTLLEFAQSPQYIEIPADIVPSLSMVRGFYDEKKFTGECVVRFNARYLEWMRESAK